MQQEGEISDLHKMSKICLQLFDQPKGAIGLKKGGTSTNLVLCCSIKTCMIKIYLLCFWIVNVQIKNLWNYKKTTE